MWALLPANVPQLFASARTSASTDTPPRGDKLAPISVSSRLYDLVLDLNWSVVERHASLHPVDASYQDSDSRGETPLYLACQFRPSATSVRALLWAYPQAAFLPQTKNRDLPLHIACRYGASIEVLRELLVADGIHGFEKDASSNHNKQQIVNKTVLFRSRFGKTPFTALWDGHRSASKAAATSATEGGDEEEATIIRMREEQFWKKLTLLLKAAARGRIERGESKAGLPSHVELNSEVEDENDEEDNFLHLHTALRLGTKNCPRPVLDFIVETRPDQISTCDPNDLRNLPLHVALSGRWNFRSGTEHDDILLSLLRSYPEAASVRNDSGSLPLHLALGEKGQCRRYDDPIVQHIFRAYPDALCEADGGVAGGVASGLHPFMMAAAIWPLRPRMSSSTLDGSYELLRARPDVLLRYLDSASDDAGTAAALSCDGCGTGGSRSVDVDAVEEPVVQGDHSVAVMEEWRQSVSFFHSVVGVCAALAAAVAVAIALDTAV